MNDGLSGRVLAWAEGRRMLVGGAALLVAVLAVASVLAIGGGDNGDDTDTDVSNRAAPRSGDDDVTSGAVDTETTLVPAETETDTVDVDAVASAFRAQTPGASPTPRPPSGSTSTVVRAAPASASGSVSNPPRPLHITQAGWAQTATSQHGWVPPEGLPAGQQGGNIDRYSFFRLDGTGTSLRLNLMSREGPLNESAGVAVCPITSESWRAANGQSMNRAPAYDSLDCVVGKKVDKSVYNFDLARYPVRTGGNGFALVPRGPVGSTFEIVLDRTSAG